MGEFADYTPLRWTLFTVGLEGSAFFVWGLIYRFRAELEMDYRRGAYTLRSYARQMSFMISETFSLTFASPLAMLSEVGRDHYKRFRKWAALGAIITIPVAVADLALFGAKQMPINILMLNVIG